MSIHLCVDLDQHYEVLLHRSPTMMAVTLELVRRGYTEEQIAKIWGGNLLRLMAEVEKMVAKSKQNAPASNVITAPFVPCRP